MYCSNCGSELQTQAKYCQRCGAPAIQASVTSSDSATSAPMRSAKKSHVVLLSFPSKHYRNSFFVVLGCFVALLVLFSQLGEDIPYRLGEAIGKEIVDLLWPWWRFFHSWKVEEFFLRHPNAAWLFWVLGLAVMLTVAITLIRLVARFKSKQ